VTEPEVPFFHKRKSILKIDRSVKMPWQRLRMGVVSSYSSAPSNGKYGHPNLFFDSSATWFPLYSGINSGTIKDTLIGRMEPKGV